MTEKELVEEYENGYSELRNIMKVLTKDLKMCERRAKKDSNQFWRRAYARALFAYIEAMTYRKKVQAMLAHNMGEVSYSSAELAMILEKTYELNEKGEARTKDRFSNLDKNLRFAFHVYARTYRIKYHLECSGPRWDYFKKALKVRHRVTHPKTLDDLNITDDEMRILAEAYDWYMYNELKLQVITREVLRQRNKRLREQVVKLKRAKRAKLKQQKKAG